MFWDIFKELCCSEGIAPTAKAIELGFSNATATKWKKGSLPSGATLQKIADHFGVTVDYLLGKTSSPNVARLPVYGNVAAGIPSEAITYIDDFEDVDLDDFPVGEYAALRVKGQSMEPRMFEGDVVIVRVQDTIETGDIAIVLVNGEDATCKKIKKTPEGIMLVPFNSEYDPIFYTNKEIAERPVRIWGKVVELRSKF